jgi:hypothetical protein
MGSPHSRRWRWTAIAASVLAVLAVVSIVLVTTRKSGKSHADATPPPPSTSASTPAPSTRPTTRTAPPTPKKPSLASSATVNAALRKLAAQLPAGGVSVAALNTKTGAQYSFGAGSGMRTGSVAKLFVLEAALLAHERDGTELSDGEMALATPMIENSDNKAEYSLYLDIGGRDTLEDAAGRLGMRHTVPGDNDPALTTTSAEDGLQMLAPLLAKPPTVAGVPHKPLSAYSRSLALGLMRDVESDQRWGVSAVADPGTTVALKNGWLSVDNENGPGDNDDDRWLVNSVGIVTVRGQQVLLSAFTQHGPDYQSGVDLVEALVKAITPAVVAR